MKKIINSFLVVILIAVSLTIPVFTDNASIQAQAAESEYTTGTYITTIRNLNFRAGPGTNYIIHRKVPIGTVVEVTDFNGEWGYIKYDGLYGWISMTYLMEYDDTHHDLSKYSVSWKVLDVSKWQGKIDWAKVAGAGYKAVILRIGCRGTASGELILDTKFSEYYEGAKAQGLYIGCYFYSAARSTQQAVAEAEFIIDTIKKYNIELDMPAYLDMEDPVVEKCGGFAIFNMTKAFLERMDKENIYSGVYCSASWAQDYYNKALFNTHALWLADWDGKCSYSGGCSYGMWQYSKTGRVDGIETKYTDLNTCYVNYPQLIEDYGYNCEKADEQETTTVPVTETTEENTSIEMPSGNNAVLSLGDIDGNGKIASSDARTALRIAAGLYKATAAQFSAADLDRNNKITASDARNILRISAKLDSIENYTVSHDYKLNETAESESY